MTDRELELTNVVQEQAARITELEAKLLQAKQDYADHIRQTFEALLAVKPGESEKLLEEVRRFTSQQLGFTGNED